MSALILALSGCSPEPTPDRIALKIAEAERTQAAEATSSDQGPNSQSGEPSRLLESAPHLETDQRYLPSIGYERHVTAQMSGATGPGAAEATAMAAIAAASVMVDPPDRSDSSSSSDNGSAAPMRTDLLAEALGYGGKTTGGLNGPLVHVTSLADAGPGSLREAAALEGPAWIIFDVDGVINLRERLWLTSNKTIDGRGRSIEIHDHGLALRGVENVIITNLRLVRGQRDGVDVHGGSRHIWLHHLSVAGFEDGAIDITRGATDVTVSWSRIGDQRKVMLVGADDDHEKDADIRVTLHHTLFEGTGQRHPRVRWGRVHAFNNVVDQWDSYGMAASQHGQLRSEHNVFMPGPDSEEAIKASAGDAAPGMVASIGDLVIGEALIEARMPDAVFNPALDYAYSAWLDDANEELVALLRARAGWRAVDEAE